MPTTVLRIPTADGLADAFAAFPDDGRRHPGVLMYPDGFGIRPVLRDMAVELAGHGYYVLVPNIFYRHGPTPVIELPEHIGEEARSLLMAQVMPLIGAHTAERVRSDAGAYLGYLTGRPEVSDGPVAVTGYCIGGLLAMRTAAAHPDRVAAVAGFHAPVGADGPGLFSTVTAQVHFGHAEGDLTPEGLVELNQSLDAAGVGFTSEIYPGTVHGFTMSDTDAFNASGLRRHWDRLLPLLRRALTVGWVSGMRVARLLRVVGRATRVPGPGLLGSGRFGRQPTADSRQPTADSRQPTADSRQPTAASRQPTAASRQPPADSRQPPADSRSATGAAGGRA